MNAQTKTNVELINDLLDKSIDETTHNMGTEDVSYYFEFSSLPEYALLKDKVISSASRKLPLIQDESKSIKSIKYILDKTGIYYNKTFKDGFLGSYKVERIAELQGSYLVSFKNQVIESKEFSYAVSDTVDYDELKSLESISLPFARSEMPPEPLLPSLLEPAIAIAAIAVTIILFFTVRSN